MSDADLQHGAVDLSAANVASPPTNSNNEVDDNSSLRSISPQDVNGDNTNSAGRPENAQHDSPQEDAERRSPKRRRLNAGEEAAEDNVEVDFEAAAARALAISLGVNEAGLTPTPSISQTSTNGANALPSAPTTQNLVPSDQQARLENLPALDEVATQILSTLSKMSHLEIGEMLFGPPSQRGKDYRALKVRFEQAKQRYLTNSPFISPPVLGISNEDQIAALRQMGVSDVTQADVFRKTNMATFMASIFSGEIGLRIMDINFLDVFVPEGGRLLKAQASIYLELKTQAFIAAKRTAPAMLNQVMLDLFPTNMENDLLMKRPGAKSLAPSEIDFLKRLASRRDILYADMRNNRLENLEQRYRWDDFSREVNNYLSKNYDFSGTTTKDQGDQSSPGPARPQLQQGQMEGQFSLPTTQSDSTSSTMGVGPDLDFNIDVFMAQAARAAEIALHGGSHTGFTPARLDAGVLSQTPAPTTMQATVNVSPLDTAEKSTSLTSTKHALSIRAEKQDNMDTTKTEFQQYKPVTVDSAIAMNAPPLEIGSGNVPHQSQTAPTQVLYERARLVTTNKVSPSSRKPNPPSHRRPWTNEEENALMTGLDQVKGPHWSQILAMYGPGGTINESLKDRNQVQLKDKARNLKLFFLKAGIEVPYYLQAVTGDLKTRAPGQAEKREARERERTNMEEDDVSAQPDEINSDAGEDADHPIRSTIDQEDIQDSTTLSQQAGIVNQEKFKESEAAGEGDAFDMEAMIARAAASATRSLENHWP